MGTSERRTREKQELRVKIQEAATELIVSEGYQNVSIRKIADRIEYAPSTIYLYFKDKEELVQSICNDLFAQLSTILQQIQDSPSPIEQKLSSCCRAYIEFGLAHPNHYVVTFCIPERQFDIADDKFNDVLDSGLSCFRLLSQSLQVAMDAGFIKPSDIELTSQIVWSQIHGLTSLLICCDRFPWRDRNDLIDGLIRNIIESLQKTG